MRPRAAPDAILRCSRWMNMRRASDSRPIMLHISTSMSAMAVAVFHWRRGISPPTQMLYSAGLAGSSPFNHPINPLRIHSFSFYIYLDTCPAHHKTILLPQVLPRPAFKTLRNCFVSRIPHVHPHLLSGYYNRTQPKTLSVATLLERISIAYAIFRRYGRHLLSEDDRRRVPLEQCFSEPLNCTFPPHPPSNVSVHSLSAQTPGNMKLTR